jgi:hypothetical protein
LSVNAAAVLSTVFDAFSSTLDLSTSSASSVGVHDRRRRRRPMSSDAPSSAAVSAAVCNVGRSARLLFLVTTGTVGWSDKRKRKRTRASSRDAKETTDESEQTNNVAVLCTAQI